MRRLRPRHLIGLLLAAWPAFGLADAPGGVEERLEVLRREAESLAAEREKLGGRERAVLAELASLTAARDLAAAEARAARARQAWLLREAETAAAAARCAEERQAASLGALAVRLRLLERAGPGTELPALLSTGDPESIIAALRLASDHARLDARLAAAARAGREEAARLAAELTTRRKEAEVAAGRAEAAEAKAGRAIEERDRRLQEIRRTSTLISRAAEELTEAARRLDAFLAGPREALPAGPDPLALKGTLPWPASGPVTVPFGPKRHPRFGTVVPHSGIDIGAPVGESVLSVADGQVRFAGWFEGYGRTVIIDHGNGVATVSAHLASVLVEPGRVVSRGELIGTVGDSGTVDGPSLYFEVRRGGRAEEPLSWLAPSPKD